MNGGGVRALTGNKEFGASAISDGAPSALPGSGIGIVKVP